jgi:Icc-related predicted phosphoesterase
MKILAIGDFHGKLPAKLKKRIKKVDLILSTGDFGGSDKLLDIVFKYFDEGWYNVIGEDLVNKYVLEDYNSGKNILNTLDSLCKPVYTTMGNWDFGSNSKRQRSGGLKLKSYPELVRGLKGVSLFNRAYKKIKDLHVLFFGGLVTAGAYLDKGNLKENKRKKYIKINRKEIKHIMKYSDKPVDIVVAHCAPFGYFDKVKYDGENPMNGKHVGFKGYNEFIRKNGPALFICGHMHEHQGKKKIGKTTIVSTGAAKDGKAAIIDFDEEKGKVKSVEFIK